MMHQTCKPSIVNATSARPQRTRGGGGSWAAQLAGFRLILITLGRSNLQLSGELDAHRSI